MVSDWQGGDISKLFPALSGKEDLSMGEDKKADKKRKRIVPKAPVQMIISREYVGTQTVTEAFIPDYFRGYSEEDCRGRHLRQ